MKNIIDGAKPTGTVGGQGGVDFPKTAIKMASIIQVKQQVFKIHGEDLG